MTPLHAIGCTTLTFSTVCAFLAWRRGEWVSLKRANEQLNADERALGDLPNLDCLNHGSANK